MIPPRTSRNVLDDDRDVQARDMSEDGSDRQVRARVPKRRRLSAFELRGALI